VRSTREPQAAWLSFVNGEPEVELLGSEDGVSPGQACVFYDAAAGQARVLGGGFIRETEAFTGREGYRAAAAAAATAQG
jgi:tRNA-specific 2-thiouridylase